MGYIENLQVAFKIYVLLHINYIKDTLRFQRQYQNFKGQTVHKQSFYVYLHTPLQAQARP